MISGLVRNVGRDVPLCDTLAETPGVNVVLRLPCPIVPSNRWLTSCGRGVSSILSLEQSSEPGSLGLVGSRVCG